MIDPVIFSIGPLQVRWYGLMYVVGFLVGGKILAHLSKKGFLPMPVDKIDKYVTSLIIGMFLGARLTYVFVYNWSYYSNHLTEILSVWKGGLSFHGAVGGMVLATYWFCKKNKIAFIKVTDSMAVAGSPGLFFGRMGNFINGELYGRITDSPLGIVFPGGGPYPRHASQLYEGISEGIILFMILWFVHTRQKIYGVVTVLFLMGYGIFRYTVEFFREPDAQLGYYFGGTTTMGQILCLIMVIVSLIVYQIVKKKNIKNPLVNG